MTAHFPLTNGRDETQLIEHLAAHRLLPPSNCIITIQTHIAIVHSQCSYALGTARTAW